MAPGDGLLRADELRPTVQTKRALRMLLADPGSRITHTITRPPYSDSTLPHRSPASSAAASG